MLVPDFWEELFDRIGIVVGFEAASAPPPLLAGRVLSAAPFWFCI
jgi:hypothetical protein